MLDIPESVSTPIVQLRPPPGFEPTDSGTVVYMTQHAITTELRCLYAVEKV